MTRLKRMMFISTAIVLCILTVSAGMCTVVYTPGDNVRSARIFAVPVSKSIDTPEAPSLSKPQSKAVISWVRKDEFLFEKNDLYKLSPSLDSHFSLSNVFCNTNYLTGDLYIPSKSTSYYMRI